MMERRLLRPFDEEGVDFECEGVTRLKDRREFRDPTDWAIYQAKVFYEGFGDIEKAIEMLEAEQTRAPRDSNVMFCLAECYSRTSDRLVRAVELCTTGLSIDASSDYAYTIKARSQLAELSHFAGFKAAKAFRISEGYQKVFTTAKAGGRLGAEGAEGLATP